ncbi:hypothetical protein N566_18255 [Streptomycetaceae bacterium MP113-05]|nr:hypothetical protein N566_18255 [Streptomycetaceae bacterium MP113-05]
MPVTRLSGRYRRPDGSAIPSRSIAEVDRVRRAVFAGLPSEPTRHLGEAETCVLITTRQEFRSSIWITDDASAGRFARRRGITTKETFDLMNEAVVDGLVTAEEGHRLLADIVAAGNHLHRISRHPRDLLA